MLFSSLQLEIFHFDCTHFDGQVWGPNLVGQLPAVLSVCKVQWNNSPDYIHHFILFWKKSLRNHNINTSSNWCLARLYQCWVGIWKIRRFDRISKPIFGEYHCERFSGYCCGWVISGFHIQDVGYHPSRYYSAPWYPETMLDIKNVNIRLGY